MKGDEEGLYENLASLARQDYPEYEILVGAEDALDPALEVARSVQADHPTARIRIQAGNRRLGLNPKVNLLAALAERARHDHLLVSDSNVRVQPRYLRETAAELEDPRLTTEPERCHRPEAARPRQQRHEPGERSSIHACPAEECQRARDPQRGTRPSRRSGLDHADETAEHRLTSHRTAVLPCFDNPPGNQGVCLDERDSVDLDRD